MENYKIKETKDESRYKKIIRNTKTFIINNWKILLLIVLLMTSFELCYHDSFKYQKGGQYTTYDSTMTQAKKRFGIIGEKVVEAPSRIGYFISDGISKIPEKIMESEFVRAILYGLLYIGKSLLTLLIFILLFMAIPMVPLLFFMLVMFFILRNGIGRIKQM
jgi:hypothetical protein